MSKRLRHENDTLAAEASRPACASSDTALKRPSLARFAGRIGLRSVKGNISDCAAVAVLLAQYRPKRVADLATQADARDSTEDPNACVDANLVGFNDVHSERCAIEVEALIDASLSSA